MSFTLQRYNFFLTPRRLLQKKVVCTWGLGRCVLVNRLSKFIDKVGSADQEAETATEQAKDDKDGGEVSIPEGYRKTDDTVYVSGESLNLRSEPNTSDDSTIVENVNQGTEFKRIAVSEDGAWALLEYNGKIVYGYQNYLAVKDE